MTIRILRFSAALLLAGTLLLGHGTGIVSLLGAETTAASFYVAPNGSPNGDGSIGNPWNLQTALSQPAAVKPGDTIWVRGGTYTGGVGWAYSFSSTLKGAAGLPISVRQYPGERATIDGRGAVYGALLVQYSAWTLFQNLEITDSDVARSPLTSGLWVRDSNNIKFINMVVHDLPGQGIGFWQENSDSEIYGTLIYYNGVDFQEHGIYTGNQVGTKRISDNIIFTNAGYGVHGYASTATGYENNIRIEGNIAFDNGLLVPGAPPQGNILIGTTSASSPAANPAIFNNATYHRTINMGAGSQEFGYVNGCTLPLVSGNYFVGETRWANCTTNASITGNTFYGNQVSYSGPLPSASTFPSNVYTTSRPTGFRVVVRGNQYEAGRANVAVYNWGLASSVNVDLSGVVAAGASYEIRDAQNFFGPPVRSGVYAGGTVSLPMNGGSVSPVAYPLPIPTGPEFKAFVILSGQGSLPSPTPTGSTPTPVPPNPTVVPPTPTPAPGTPTAAPTTPTPLTPTPTPTARVATATPAPAPRVANTPKAKKPRPNPRVVGGR
ncbi:MAG: right-handed parallel beta-helix repeat-containing protein [Thermoanaerobaculia bacterium]